MPMSLASDDARDAPRDATRDARGRGVTMVCARGFITGEDMTRARVSRPASPCPERGCVFYISSEDGA